MRALVPLTLLWACLVCLVPQPAPAQTGQELRHNPVVEAVKTAASAVVNIQASRVVERQNRPWGQFFGSQHMLRPFFEEFFSMPRERRVHKSLGTGVIINGSSRLVLTNAHVITGAADISVRLLDGRTFAAELVGSEPDFDLALLKLEGEDTLPEAEMGGSEDLLIGETVIAIGNPYGFSHTVTTGVISAQDRSVDTKHGTYMGFIQTDAAINPGNSGGPLLNILGRVIGITTAIHAKAQGIGFAIPIDKAKQVVMELMDHGQVQPVWFGLSGQNVDQPTAKYLGLPRARGMLITQVLGQTPAARAGMQPGDVLWRLNGTEVQDKEHYLRLMRNVTQKTQVRLQLFRNGETQEVKLSPQPYSQQQALALARERWGMTVESGAEYVRVHKVSPGSPAQKLGLQSGDRLYKVAGTSVQSAQDFAQAFMRHRLQNSVLLLVARGEQAMYVRLRM